MLRAYLYEAAYVVLARVSRFLIAQELGRAPRRAQGLEEGHGRRGPEARHDPLPNLDRRDDVPLGPADGYDLTANIVTFRFPLGNGWNSGPAGTAVG